MRISYNVVKAHCSVLHEGWAVRQRGSYRSGQYRGEVGSAWYKGQFAFTTCTQVQQYDEALNNTLQRIENTIYRLGIQELLQ